MCGDVKRILSVFRRQSRPNTSVDCKHCANIKLQFVSYIEGVRWFAAERFRACVVGRGLEADWLNTEQVVTA